MASSSSPSLPSNPNPNEEDRDPVPTPINQNLELTNISTLPLNEEWRPIRLREYQGFWIAEPFLAGVQLMQQSFVPLPSDVILASQPKCGTTWLKAMAFAAVTRTKHLHSLSDHPLLRLNPHDLVPIHLELFFIEQSNAVQLLDKQFLDSPRLFSSHVPCSLLPAAVTAASSSCRIIYVAREPKDAFVSRWLFNERVNADAGLPSPELEKGFELFCRGISPYGPIWEHELEYWRESRRRPEKVMFLKYEEMIEDPARVLRKMAEFLGCPFSDEEEEEGTVEKLVKFCSFESLVNVEESKKGSYDIGNEMAIKKSSFFRKGRISDWAAHISPEMARKMDAITGEKFRGSGLRF